MKQSLRTIFSLALSCVGLPIVTLAGDVVPPATNSSTTRPMPAARRHFSLDLPDYGSPKNPSKIGGCRTPGENLIVAALAPGDPGLTIYPSPTLYWYVSNSTPHNIEFTLTRVGAVDPVLDLTFDGSTLHGLQSIDLASHGVRLEMPQSDASIYAGPTPETSAAGFGANSGKNWPLYEWVVAVVRDPDRRSRDVIGVGFIERAPSNAKLQSHLNNAGEDHAGRAVICAHANLWYDAVSEINTAIDAEPLSVELREARTGLLSQVALSLNLDGPDAPTTNAPLPKPTATTGPSVGLR